MSKRYDLAVFIGRFQPFHQGHLQVALDALEKADEVLFIVGSANVPRSTRNPFTANERVDLIWDVMADQKLGQSIHTVSMNDFPYDDNAWADEIRGIVSSIATMLDSKKSVAITGYDRDESSFYLHMFPEYDFIAPSTDLIGYSATGVRNQYFTQPVYDQALPATLPFLNAFRETPAFHQLATEYAGEQQYQRQWGRGPFQCTDAMVIQDKHLLVVRRGDFPGKGKLALPGGHLNLNERLLDCAVRELLEETCLFEANYNDYARREKLLASLMGSLRFDDPYRSPCARMITEAFLFMLPSGPLPTVTGGDDAADAFWLPLSEIPRHEFFSDHATIINRMIKHFGVVV